ncbi:hypothetical protein NGRA_0421 [Nosema granulosis]|uniref:Uncharacterized protein n=1 Tax=Nosema granulosis TaxID=83296 RepID=A0A9P6L022_9MICR|nr:hypothetical protein NGRA_0421 [Nosema granulosis]
MDCRFIFSTVGILLFMVIITMVLYYFKIWPFISQENKSSSLVNPEKVTSEEKLLAEKKPDKKELVSSLKGEEEKKPILEEENIEDKKESKCWGSNKPKDASSQLFNMDSNIPVLKEKSNVLEPSSLNENKKKSKFWGSNDPKDGSQLFPMDSNIPLPIGSNPPITSV